MRPQRGVALLATVLVVALATILIAGLLDRGMIGQARALQQTRATQAMAFQQGLELWAARMLREDQERNLGAWSRGDAWAQPMPPITVPEGMIQGTMRDLDGCLNLNALVVDGAGDIEGIEAKRFERLFDVLDVDERLLAAIIDWSDADTFSERGGGAEDAIYATLDPPRRAANRPFVHVSELRAVAGVDAEIYARLAPHVCARPPGTAININTASAQVLMSLSTGIGPALAQRLYSDGRARWSGADDFLDQLRTELIEPLPVMLGVGTVSRHFVAEAELIIGEVPVRLYSVLERGEDGRIVVAARSQGRF